MSYLAGKDCPISGKLRLRRIKPHMRRVTATNRSHQGRIDIRQPLGQRSHNRMLLAIGIGRHPAQPLRGGLKLKTPLCRGHQSVDMQRRYRRDLGQRNEVHSRIKAVKGDGKLRCRVRNAWILSRPAQTRQRNAAGMRLALQHPAVIVFRYSSRRSNSLPRTRGTAPFNRRRL